MERKHFTFVGTTSVNVSLDPAEFAGKSVPQITAEVMHAMAELAPGVSFFPDDIALAANELAT